MANFFDRLDGNKDGYVTGAEVAAAQAKRKGSGGGRGGSGKKAAGGGDSRKKSAGGSAGGFTGASFLQRLDKNADGKVSKDEAPGRMKESFDETDTNSDGFLDKAELDKLVEAMRARLRDAGADGGGGGGQ